MRSVSTALSAALGAPVQQPAILVQAAFTTPRYWSSFANITFGGNSYLREDIAVEGLQIGALQIEGTLVVGNADDAIGALVLSEGVQDRAFTLWGYDAAATATGDVVFLAQAVGAGAQVAEGRVQIELRHRAQFMLSPRTYITAGATFGPLLAAGTVLKINGQDFQLARRN